MTMFPFWQDGSVARATRSGRRASKKSKKMARIRRSVDHKTVISLAVRFGCTHGFAVLDNASQDAIRRT